MMLDPRKAREAQTRFKLIQPVAQGLFMQRMLTDPGGAPLAVAEWAWSTAEVWYGFVAEHTPVLAASVTDFNRSPS